MTWNDVTANFPAFIARITTRWPDLDRDDVAATDGDRERFEALLAARPDHDARTARAAVDEWLEGEVPSDVMMDETVANQRILASRQEMAPDEDAYSQDGKFGDDHIPEPPIGRDSDGDGVNDGTPSAEPEAPGANEQDGRRRA